MSRLTGTVVVQRPPQDVFEYLTQVNRHGEWSPKPWRVEGDPGPLALGTKFTSIGVVPGDKSHRNEVEVTDCTPPSRIRWETDEKEGHFANTFVLTPEGSGTRVERVFEIPEQKGFVGVIFPLISRFLIRPNFQKGLSLFKQRLES